MKKLDTTKANQRQKQSKKTRSENSLSKRSKSFITFVNVMKGFVVLVLALSISLGIVMYAQTDFSFGDDFTAFDLSLSSTIYCENKYGEYIEYEQFKSSDKRIWVDIEKVPEDLKDAFVAIEDQRFYSHAGVDLKRTLGAAINVFLKGDSSYGGSTITQQLVKNITQDKERTKARKLREISRALVLETKMDKDQILEMYMNSIYLSQGVHGVQAASHVYFGKDVSKLSLAESACIAGITQFPTTFDPLLNPENNKRKQTLVLSKMLELGFIDEAEYEKAINEELVFMDGEKNQHDTLTDDTQSYFADFIFEQAKKDLMNEFGYTEVFAEDLLCNRGLKIYATVDPEVQNTMEDYYENSSNFPNLYGSDIAQSAMVIMNPSNGQVKGIVGGRGEKEGARILNRASQSKRQPGSSIKPIAVYAPALEENVVNLSSTINNLKLTVGDWTPKNSNGKYTAPVTIQSAVAYSYNVPAINVLKDLGVDKSFSYLKDKLHISTLIDSVTKNGKVYSDKNLSSLALGGLTEGVTPLEMTAAYSALANGGVYIEPTSYTKIYDKAGKLFYEKKPFKTRAFSEETAFLTQQLLKGVVQYGTAGGSVIGNNDTCGKTGTTDDNKDKWFIGFTPHYCAGVWFGYDSPKVVSTGTNPSLAVWKNIMTDIHSGLSAKTFKKPSGIVSAEVCPYTGVYESQSAPTIYVNKKFLTGYCKGKNHGKYIGWSEEDDKILEEMRKEEEEKLKAEQEANSAGEETPSDTESTENTQTTSKPSQEGETPLKTNDDE